MPAFTDQMGRTITLERPPVRIISLVPSQTELLYTLGLDNPTAGALQPDPPFEVVGITKFCVHPSSWFREKPRIGGTKDIHPERIDALRPDIIIANKEENDRGQIESLAARYPVWISDVRTLPDALAMIRAVGELVGRPAQALTLATAIEKAFGELPPTPTHPPRTAYFIWRKPWMVAGSHTFIDDMLRRCGLTNIFGDQDRYPVVDTAHLANRGCELVLLSSEPYPFREQHIAEIQTLLPNASIRLVDGELFSWYGSRLLHAPAYFAATF
ncbi:MAG TPA: helical backbone metal receptor [Puia sp.]|jgi:ABC-type Fe3+-hydroxamate transport system substrate-binding protein|nr:helical backbone metal receptor [Puia sp.]